MKPVASVVISLLSLQTGALCADSDGLERVYWLYWQGRYEQVIRTTDSLLATGTVREVECYKMLALGFQALHNHSVAKDYFRRALMLDSTSASLWREMAKSLEALGDWREAQASFYRALELDPENPDLRAKLALRHIELNEWQKGKELLEFLLARDTLNPYLYDLLGRCLLGLQQWDDCIVAFEKSNKLNPANFSVLLQLSGVYLAKNEPISALRVGIVSKLVEFWG